MKRIILALWLFWSVEVLANQSETFSLTLEDWSLPHSGESLVEIRALREVMLNLYTYPQKTLVIAYPAGESGELWAEQLQQWLVSLGLSSERIRRVSELFSADVLRQSNQQVLLKLVDVL
jgi:hypothetical protein